MDVGLIIGLESQMFPRSVVLCIQDENILKSTLHIDIKDLYYF